MSTDPIARLLSEHQDLMARLEPFRRAVSTAPEAADDATLAALREGARIMTTDLIAHAKREDDVFFPALEAAVGGAFGPTTVMRSEHASIHAGADEFHATLQELNEVQHPAIVEGGAKLRRLVEDAADPAALRTLGAQLLALIDDHFAKEEQILFPMSRNLLDESQLAVVAREMEELDAR
ncbi:MAG: hemerythrin domain-containing protein [Candidatus Eisenbacteria bacterium]|uniref:Hemerythrin domain-containing protein n=1 Tax=Eiseniibacteriota bacterium TaxID=2212470 RepID=A0A933SDI7_UNCEI|nr:hemerythrin domain-containing protein [Candidatus Eisenbacteria bacterium]